MEYTRPT